MIENIKNMWNIMISETKEQAVNAIMEEFGRSKVATKQNWIYQGMIPEEHQPRVVEIFQNCLKQQEQRSREIRESIA